MNDIEKKVIKITADKLFLEVGEVKGDSLIREDLGADSLDYVGLIMELEKEFGIAIPDDKASGVRTVNDLVNVVKEIVK